MKTRILRWTALASLCALGLVACDRNDTGDVDEATGVRLTTVALSSEDVAGVLYNIECEGQDGINQYVMLEEEGLPPHISQDFAGQPFADYFTVVNPGVCNVTATAMLNEDTPIEECSRVSQEVDVAEGETTEVVLQIQCNAQPTGALDVVTVITDGVTITDVNIGPSKFIATCEEASVDVSSSGGDEATYSYEVVGQPEGSTFTLTPNGPNFTFKGDNPGQYTIQITVEHNGQQTSLTIPIHVSEAPELCEPAVPCGGECPDDSVCNPVTNQCQPCENFTEPFSVNPLENGWILEGDTEWIDDSYIRLTPELSNQRGTLYHPTQVIPSGDTSIQFDFRITNEGQSNNSADGLALSIVNLGPNGDLATVVGGTENGGGIGYHNPDAVMNGDVISAVTVEIDQFYNTRSDAFGQVAEVTSVPHLAVHTNLNSRPASMVDYVELPYLPDDSWHTARVDIVAGTLTISIDGDVQLTSSPGLSTEGGHIFFSSATASEYDQHDIDQVQILGGCGN
jgi:hypothetical protein